ncbi:hypothetical protein SAMN05216178_2921 [Pseudomonas saponiphila]|uniref:Uncharacterized protein n=1 Tax=Pseudomonas saponiphila TaxID=556534 RepID=A0A1H4NNY9_9PSED|nr:hypothetical protein SAMN05216178_2921 [Pseudomonas saponiphila]
MMAIAQSSGVNFAHDALCQALGTGLRMSPQGRILAPSLQASDGG